MIVGFNTDKLEADKTQGAAQGSLQVNYTPEITDVETAKVNAIDGEVAKINYTFRVSYTVGETEAAYIQQEGNLLWNGDTETITQEWEENQQLPENVNKKVINDLYRKCLTQAVGVAKTLGLLPPFPTPTVNQ
ncbi:MAG: hypothetical protein ABEJ83_02410 [Candidatus Nanohaloarchaea archaeon]